MLQDKSSKYVVFAKSIMKALPPEQIPVDLADTHMFIKACEMSAGFHDQLGEEDLRDAMGSVSDSAESVSLSKVMRVSSWCVGMVLLRPASVSCIVLLLGVCSFRTLRRQERCVRCANWRARTCCSCCLSWVKLRLLYLYMHVPALPFFVGGKKQNNEAVAQRRFLLVQANVPGV